MSKITRRETLTRGGQAIAVAAALPFISSINPAQAQEDAELFALYEECKQLENEHMAATNRYEVTSRAASRRFAGLPPYEPTTLKRLVLGTPEYEAFIHKALADSALIDAAEKQRPGGLAEAKKQAGVPALEKKYDANLDSWLTALDRLYDTPAHTPAGMILKLKIEWTDHMRRDWQAKGRAADVEIPDDAVESVLMDLERLSGRAV